MKLLYPRCCVLAPQGQTLLACLRTQEPDSPAHDELRTFDNLPAALPTLSEWLAAHAVTHVAIDSADHGWRAVYAALQHTCTVLLIEAGRVTGRHDIGRIAALLAYGLEPCRPVRPVPSQESSGPPPLLREPFFRSRRQVIPLLAILMIGLLVTWVMVTRRNHITAENSPSLSSSMVRWPQSTVSFQYPAGKPLVIPLPELQRNPGAGAVEVLPGTPEQWPDWLEFDQQGGTLRGIAPNLTENKTYQLGLVAQTDADHQSRLQIALTITGQAAAAPVAPAMEAASPRPSQPAQPAMPEAPAEQAQLISILRQTTSPVSDSPEEPPQSAPDTALPTSPTHVVDQDCMLKILSGQPCADASAAEQAHPSAQ